MKHLITQAGRPATAALSPSRKIIAVARDDRGPDEQSENRSSVIAGAHVGEVDSNHQGTRQGQRQGEDQGQAPQVREQPAHHSAASWPRDPRRKGSAPYRRYEALLKPNTVGQFLKAFPKWGATIARAVREELIEIT